MCVRRNGKLSSVDREISRARWRSFLLPRWRQVRGDVLTEEEGVALGLRLGIVNNLPLTQRQIGRRLYCCGAKVADLEISAMRKVRAFFQIVKELPDETS